MTYQNFKALTPAPHRITDEMIEAAKLVTPYPFYVPPYHQHNDCIRICFEFLDAQTVTKKLSRHSSMKHSIECWAGRYVSGSDVLVAATLHPLLFTDGEDINVSPKTIFPSLDRLLLIPEAFQHAHYRASINPSEFVRYE